MKREGMRMTMWVLLGALVVLGAAPAFAETAMEALGWRLGCQLWSFNRFTFAEGVAKTAEVGLKYVEAFPGQRLSPDLPEDVKFHHDMAEEHRARAKQILADAGVTLVNYGVVGLPNNEEEARKVFDFAKDMGVETIVSEPGRPAIELLDKLAEEYEINVAIHNHPKPSLYWTYERVLEAVEGRGPRIGACADTGHWMRSGINPLEAVKALEGRIISFHLKDLGEFNVRAAHDVIWGTGKGDIAAILAEVKRQGIKPVFAIEYEHNWENNVPDIAACVAFFNQVAETLTAKAE